MPITRDNFLSLLKQTVINSEPAGDYFGLETFAVIPSLKPLDANNIHDLRSSASNWFFSKQYASSGKKVDNLPVAAPFFLVQPLSESPEDIRGTSISRRNIFRFYFLGQYVEPAPGKKHFSPFAIQNAMGIHATRVFRLLADAVYANQDGGDYEWTFKVLLDRKVSQGLISEYDIKETETKAGLKRLRLPNTIGGYVDAYTAHNLWGTTYRVEFIECVEDDYSLSPSKFCC